MRAKEYFEQWKESPPAVDDHDDITNCGNEFLVLFFEEMAEIFKQRSIGRAISARSVVRELDDKWKVFAGLVNGEYGKSVLSLNAFMEALRITDPDFYSKVMEDA